MPNFIIDLLSDTLWFAALLIAAAAMIFALYLLYDKYRSLKLPKQREPRSLPEGGEEPPLPRRHEQRKNEWEPPAGAQERGGETTRVGGTTTGQTRGQQQYQPDFGAQPRESLSIEAYEPSTVTEGRGQWPRQDLTRRDPTTHLSERELLSEILSRLCAIYDLMLAGQRAQGGFQNLSRSVPPSEARAGSRSVSSIDAFCQLYNAAVDDYDRRTEFRERYGTIQLGTSNYMKRRRDLNINPEFEEANDGEYLAVKLDGRQDHYVVVPKFDLTFQESSHGPGAMGIVFKSANYDPRLKYRRVKVRKPAIFRRSGQRWEFDKREGGELELGAGKQY